MATLYIQYSSQDGIDPTLGDLSLLSWAATGNLTPALQQVFVNIVPGAAVNLLATFPIFPDLATAFANYMTAMCAAVVSAVNSAYGVSYYTASDPEQVGPEVMAAIVGKSNKSAFSAVTALSAHGIANASAASNPGLPTNFNLVSGVLGIANGLNDANTAQNDLATKYNDLEAKFNSALAWLGTNKDKINATITAGAA